MKNIIAACLMVLLFCGCNKNTTNNNYIDNDHMAAYTIVGLKEIVLNTDLNKITLPVTLKYTNYSQRHVQLSVTGLPPGITINSDFANSGYPTFNTTLVFYDTDFLAPANIGEYTAMLNVQEDNGAIRAFPFSIRITRPDTCAGRYAGAFPTCKDATGSIHYADSIYLDTTVTNRIWFSNFGGSGKLVQGIITNCIISIPSQVVGGVLFSGGGKFNSGPPRYVELNVKVGEHFYLLNMM